MILLNHVISKASLFSKSFPRTRTISLDIAGDLLGSPDIGNGLPLYLPRTGRGTRIFPYVSVLRQKR